MRPLPDDPNNYRGLAKALEREIPKKRSAVRYTLQHLRYTRLSTQRLPQELTDAIIDVRVARRIYRHAWRKLLGFRAKVRELDAAARAAA